MKRQIAVLVAVLALCGWAFAQGSPVDSIPPAPPIPAVHADTMFVIPSGPVAGTFTAASRLTVADTVAGWARVLVEGWVPVGAVMSRLTDSTSTKIIGEASGVSPPARQQCIAITKKGTRCKRMAQPGSKYCWQHQP